MPTHPHDKKLSKNEILRMAIRYSNYRFVTSGCVVFHSICINLPCYLLQMHNVLLSLISYSNLFISEDIRDKTSEHELCNRR